MNIHEYQSKELLNAYGILITKGILILDSSQIKEKIKNIGKKPLVIKAQIHAGGRGKAGGIKLINDPSQLENEIIKVINITNKTYLCFSEVIFLKILIIKNIPLRLIIMILLILQF